MTGRKTQDGAIHLTALLAALVPVVSLGACTTFSGARYGGPDAPLRARLASAHDGRTSLHFAVSDRAHVALFRIHDTGSVRALYPYHPGSTSAFRPGAHTVLASPPSHHRRTWSPLARFDTPFDYAPLHTSSHASSSACFGRVRTSYLMIVASRQPLAMHRIRDDVPFRYRRVPALAPPFHGGTAFGTMDRLLQRLVPRAVSREDWDVDWVVTSDLDAPCGQLLPPLLPRRIAADTDRPPAADSASGDTPHRRLDTGDLPFTPPRIPVDLPEVSRRSPAVEGRVRGWTDGPSGGDDRRGVEWGRDLDRWTDAPGRHAFPEPARPPSRRWRGGGGVDWPGRHGRGVTDRLTAPAGTPGGARRIAPPTRSDRDRDVEIRRSPSSSRGGTSDARKSGGGSDDDGGGV